jgi:hypothetical protein
MASLLEVNARGLMFDWSSPADTVIYAVSVLFGVIGGRVLGGAHGAAGEIGYTLLKVKARGWAAGSPPGRIRRGPGAGSSRRCPARPPHHGGGALPGSRKRQQSSQAGE